MFTEGKGDVEEPKNPILADGYHRLIGIIKKVSTVYIECKIEINEDEFINSFRPDMMEVTYKW